MSILYTCEQKKKFKNCLIFTKNKKKSLIQKKIYRSIPHVESCEIHVFSWPNDAQCWFWAPKVFVLKNIFCFKNRLLDISECKNLYTLTAMLISQVICVLFELLFCYFCCAFCCVFDWNMIFWVWGKFLRCFVRFWIFFWQITVANFLMHFFVSKLLVLVFSVERVLCSHWSVAAVAFVWHALWSNCNPLVACFVAWINLFFLNHHT